MIGKRKGLTKKDVKKHVGKKVNITFRDPHLLGQSVTADVIGVEDNAVVLQTPTGYRGVVLFSRIASVRRR